MINVGAQCRAVELSESGASVPISHHSGAADRGLYIHYFYREHIQWNYVIPHFYRELN